MKSNNHIEIAVGCFILASLIALFVLAFKVSGLTSFFKAPGYQVTAIFDDIGQLKIRGAVRIDGVNIGEIQDITLDTTSLKAKVTLRIDKNYNQIPEDSSAAILTSGLLGDNYIAITPMYSTNFLKEGSQINDTHSALILEKLIGQFLFNVKNNNSSKAS